MPAPVMTAASKYIAKDFFTYDINFTAGLAPAASATGYATIDTDSDFFWQKATAHATTGNDGTTVSNEVVPECDVIITDTTTGRALMNTQVPVRNIFGTGLIPFILPVEKYFGARAQISVTIYNVSDNATYSTVKLSFVGYKAFLR